MKKFLLKTALPFALMLLTASVSAQTFSIKIRLTDSGNGEPVSYATVSVSKEGSTKVLKYAQTDDAGKATLSGLAGGKYVVKGIMMGYDDFVRTVTVSGKDLDLGNCKMKVQVNYLEGATVTSVGNTIVVKKDTIEHNVSLMKQTDSDMLEDILKRLPGVEVDENGKVTANGKEITKIYIDGKAFFLDDPKLATKNLPAKIINKVKIVDKKSDQAEFTGIEDGEEETVLDLGIKKGNQDLSEQDVISNDTPTVRLHVLPRKIKLTNAFDPAKEYDTTTDISFPEDGLAKAGVLNAEVTVAKGVDSLQYQSPEVFPELVDAYERTGCIPSNELTEVSVDWSQVKFTGNEIYLQDYVIDAEGSDKLYAIILPKEIEVSATAKNPKTYDGRAIAAKDALWVEYGPTVTNTHRVVGTCGFNLETNDNPAVEAPLLPVTAFGPDAGTNHVALTQGSLTVRDENGNDKSNDYRFVFGDASRTDYVIKPRELTLEETVLDREYDGTAWVQDPTNLTHTNQVTGVGEESFTIESLGVSNAVYASAHVVYASGQPRPQLVTVLDGEHVELAGENGAKRTNYEISYAVDGTIVPRKVDVEDVTAVKSRVYDGSTVVEIDTTNATSYVLNGVVPGETLLLGGRGVYAESASGAGHVTQTVTWDRTTFAFLATDTARVSDYEVGNVEDLERTSEIDIKRFNVTLSIEATKTYDGTNAVAEADLAVTATGNEGETLTVTETSMH